MKIDRLYAITLYLLNHGRTSGSELAKHFEVSNRTIQRDIDSLCLAGIPIISINGNTGGYEISDQFKINQEFATPDEYSLILTALKGLVSATKSKKAGWTLEKLTHRANSILSSSGTPEPNNMILDFSVLREGEQENLQKLQSAIARKSAVRFLYTNNNSETRTHCVEPVAVLYRWYAWYLLAYSRVKEDYRTYKLVRMQNLEITDETFIKDHKPAEIILKETDRTDSREYTDVILRCRQGVKTQVLEYLKGTIVEEFSNGDIRVKTTVVENEFFWFGALLSFGNTVEVIEPVKIRERVINAAKNILQLYGQL